MSEHTFKQGQELKEIFWQDGTLIRVGAEPPECKSIVVEMENGQMAAVAWAVAEFNDGCIGKYNLALAEGIMIK